MHRLTIPLLVLPLLLRILCQVWFVNGNPSQSRSETRSRKPVEEWVFISGEPSDGQSTMDVPVLHSTDHSDYIPVTSRISKQSASLPWEPTKPQDKA